MEEILALAAWIVVGVAVVCAALLADLGGGDASGAAVDQLFAPRCASMRLLFVTASDDHLVVDGLLDLAGADSGIPTAWSFGLPEHPALAAAALRGLARWAEDGEPVVVDLSRVTSAHPSVSFSRDDVMIRLAAVRRSTHPRAER